MENNNPPGIFNDVLGPVMVGPSSSHTAGSHRIGSVIKQISGDSIAKVDFHFHPQGSLASTYHTQGSDIGLAAGLIDIGMADPELPDSLDKARKQGLEINFVITDYKAHHPNTYLCDVYLKDGKKFNLTALSTGGGIIEITNLFGYDCSFQMDLPLLILKGNGKEIKSWWDENQNKNFSDLVYSHHFTNKNEESALFVEFNIPDPGIPDFNHISGYKKLISPVYPTLGHTGKLLPFKIASDLEADPKLYKYDLSELALDYESARSGLSKKEIILETEKLVKILKQAIDTGLAGTEYQNRIAHAQSPEFFNRAKKGNLLPAGPMDRISAYIMAIMEAKSSMQVIVAAPTAGSAGGLPGALIGMAEEMKADKEDLIKAFLAAGLVGVFITAEATFAAEVAGCQAETGAGAAMAAAGMVQLAGGNAKQAMDAASVALQNIMGLVCDPVANRVEIPCLGRNVQAGANALISANMILGGVNAFIPLSESIKTMLDVGKAMTRELRCTALGGLSITKTAKEIEKKLNNRDMGT